MKSMCTKSGLDGQCVESNSNIVKGKALHQSVMFGLSNLSREKYKESTRLLVIFVWLSNLIAHVYELM